MNDSERNQVEIRGGNACNIMQSLSLGLGVGPGPAWAHVFDTESEFAPPCPIAAFYPIQAALAAESTLKKKVPEAREICRPACAAFSHSKAMARRNGSRKHVGQLKMNRIPQSRSTPFEHLRRLKDKSSQHKRLTIL